MTPTDLRAWREANRFTQESLSARLGVAANTIYRWESGRHPIPSFLPLALKSIAPKVTKEVKKSHIE